MNLTQKRENHSCVESHTHRHMTGNFLKNKTKKNRLITVRKNNVHTLALTDELAMNLKWTLGLSISVIFQCKYLNIPKSRHNYLRFKILSLAFWKIIKIKQWKYLSVGKKRMNLIQWENKIIFLTPFSQSFLSTFIFI